MRSSPFRKGQKVWITGNGPGDKNQEIVHWHPIGSIGVIRYTETDYSDVIVQGHSQGISNCHLRPLEKDVQTNHEVLFILKKGDGFSVT